MKFEAELDFKKNTITLEDRWMGRRTIVNDELAIVQDQLKLLMKMRRDGRRPSRHLLDDIKVYKFILCQPDPSAAAVLYMNKADELRDKYETVSVSKMLIARELGWRVT